MKKALARATRGRRRCVIEPPLESKQVYKPGDALSFNLLLVGRAVEYLPYFIYAFEELGNVGIGKGRGKYRLVRGQAIRPDNTRDTVYDGRQLRKRQPPEQLSSFLTEDEKDVLQGGKECNSVTMNLLTPLRVVSDGALIHNLGFHHLIRNLLRRASTLSYFHCGNRLDMDFNGLKDEAHKVSTQADDTEWYDWERYSARQDTRMKLGGLIGKVTFTGQIRRFLPLLKLGEIVHAGKGTSFGLGKYEMFLR